MRLRAFALPALIVPALVALAACGNAGDSESAAGSDGSTAAVSATTSATSSTAAPEQPADTEVAEPVARDLMPTATGGFGEKPTITMPSTPPPDSLQRVILSEGDGPLSKAGDAVVVDYLGQVWGGEIFDNSYDAGKPFSTQIGGPVRKVVAGWDIGLQGVKAGSRILLSFPPRDGYGPEGRAPTIGGTDTLVFVVDLLEVYPVDRGGQADAEPAEIPQGWPTVGGELGGLPTLTIPSALPQPTSPGVTIVAKGSGAPAQAGEVLVQYLAVSWDGSHTEQSWPDPTGTVAASGSGPQAFPLVEGSPFADLVGVPIGSRVLMRTPESNDGQMPAFAWVVDLIEQKGVTADQ